MKMKIDWTVKQIDFMEEFSAEVKEQGGLKSTLEHYESCLSCTDCVFLGSAVLNITLFVMILLKLFTKNIVKNLKRNNNRFDIIY